MFKQLKSDFTLDDIKYIEECIELSKKSVEHGNSPFGAMIIRNDQVIMRSENSVNTSHDPTQHAELNLIKEITQQLEFEELQECTIYTSTEPCAMCSGAIYFSGISKVVYGCTVEDLSKHSNHKFMITAREVFEASDRNIKVVGPVLAEEAIKVHETYWKNKKTTKTN